MSGCGCVLDTLSSPHLSGTLLGLQIDSGRLQIDQKMFACCGGGGTSLVDGAVRRCGLPARIKQVTNLLRQCQHVWGPQAVQVLRSLAGGRDEGPCLVTLAKIFNGESPRAMQLRRRGKEGPSPLWRYAVASSWRFGIECHVVSLGRTKIYDAIRNLEASRATRAAIFIERVGGLTNPKLAEDVESVIAEAYHGQHYLFVEFIDTSVATATQAKPAAPSFSTKGAFSRRAAALKNAAPETFLAPECLSRLESMCGNLRT